jgi:hypothetical protein
MASTITTVAKWSESAGADKGRSANEKCASSRTKTEISLSIHARELVWLDEIRRGYSIKQIARREGLGSRRIQHGVSRARKRGKISHTRESRISNGFHDQNEKINANGMPTPRADPGRISLLLHGLFPVWGRRSSGPETRPAH